MRILTVRRKRRSFDSNIWPSPSIFHLAQSLREHIIVIVVVLVDNHPGRSSWTTLTLPEGLDVKRTLPFEYWWNIILVIVIAVAFPFFVASGIWFIEAFLLCLFFFLVTILTPTLLSSIVVLLLLLERELFAIVKTKKKQDIGFNLQAKESTFWISIYNYMFLFGFLG